MRGVITTQKLRQNNNHKKQVEICGAQVYGKIKANIGFHYEASLSSCLVVRLSDKNDESFFGRAL